MSHGQLPSLKTCYEALKNHKEMLDEGFYSWLIKIYKIGYKHGKNDRLLSKSKTRGIPDYPNTK